MQSTWDRRLAKVWRYVGRGDLSGLLAEVRRFYQWKLARNQNLSSGRRPPCGQPVTEAEFWDDFNMELARKTSWTGAGDLGYWAFQKMCDGRYAEMMDLISDTMQVPRAEPLRGLVLGCGDMAGEHAHFINPNLPFSEVDAYDVSAQSLERARQLTDAKGLNVNYHIADINQVELPPDRYALAVIFHAYHHFEQVDRVAQQVNQALLPGGVLYLWDYIGPRKLQHTESQLFHAQQMLQLLPYKYRRELDGKMRQRVQSVPADTLSPDEAICSDKILDAIARHMNVVWQYNWAGLLYPLLEGIAFNFTTRDDDQALLRFLFDLDCALCQSGQVEPNFTITLATRNLASL
jgi:SAM-dependent methyltransferase